MTKLEKVFTPFVGFVLSNTDLEYDSFKIKDLKEFDGRRIYVALDDGDYSYCIRIWNITTTGVDFTLFENVGEDVIELLHGFYPTVPLQGYLCGPCCSCKAEYHSLYFESTHNKKILNRNGKDWYDEFIPSFTIDELFLMKEYISCHPSEIEYDFNDYDDVSDCVYDYIKWWVFDLLHEGEVSKAKEVLNAALI